MVRGPTLLVLGDLGMRQDEVRAEIAGLEREALNLLASDSVPLISATSQPPATLFAESRLGLPELKSIGFPYGIGCGLAGGDWNKYERLLEGFAERARDTERFIRTMINAHFIWFFGREMRYEADERALYKRLWDRVHRSGFRLKDLIRALVLSPEYGARAEDLAREF